MNALISTPTDCEVRGVENADLPNNLLMIDEAHFNLHDAVNKQNFRYWPAANPHELHHRPLYDPKVTV